MTSPNDVAALAAGLTEAQRRALNALPLPRIAEPHLWKAARPYGSIWRKASAYWKEMLSLEAAGIVERRVSRGETLWRPTKPLGLAVRAYLESTHEHR